MKRLGRQILQGTLLLALSILFYSLHYLVFRDPHHIFIYMLGDIAFVFIEVMLVTLIIHRVLHEREKNAQMEKLNMVIGAFFSEVGNKLLKILSKCDPQMETVQRELGAEGSCAESRFEQTCRCLRTHDYGVDGEKSDWDGVKVFLVSKRDFLVRLLENPALLEHESFTDVLWAVFHLTEELEAREDLSGLPTADCEHLVGDMNRVYGRLALQWLKYMEHLKASYPYLFSLSLRTNPFDRNATPVIKDSP
jgi:hypothetical protein